MKIGYVFSNLLMGGLQSVFSEFANGFSKNNEVKYTVFDMNLADPILLKRLSSIEYLSKSDLLKWSDIIFFDGMLSNEEKQFFKPKWKRTIEYLGSRRKYSLRQKILKTNLSPNIIAQSKDISDNLGVKNRIIYIGKDTNWFRPLKLDKKYDLAIIGRMRPVKNHKLFLDICKAGGFTFATIGGTHRRLEGHVNDIEKLARSHARPEIDYVPGFISDEEMLKVINQTRIGLVVSNSVGAPEGTEFMSCGVPTIVRDVGAAAELHRNEYPDLILPFDASIKEWVERIRKYLNDTNLSYRVRETILNSFSRDKTLNQFEKLFNTIIERNPI